MSNSAGQQLAASRAWPPSAARGDAAWWAQRWCVALVPALALWLLAPTGAYGQDLAIVGAEVHAEPGRIIESATVLIRNGRVRAVGKRVPIPQGVQRIDAAGKVVTAGFVEASTRLGLVEVSLVESTREGSFASNSDDPVHAAYRVSDGYNPDSVAIPVARAEGVTAAVTTPQGGLISGTGAWFALVDSPAVDPLVQGPVAMYANLGEASLANALGSRGMAVERLREVLADAAQYNRRRGEYERNQTRNLAAGRLDLEALIPVVRGELPLVVRVHRRSDILVAIKLAQQQGLRIIIEGGTEAWMVAKELAAANIGVILNPVVNLPFSFDRVHVRDDAAKVLADAGVAVAISTLGNAAQAGTIRHLAGIAVANGMSRDQALAALTTVPAQLFGVGRGRIRAGAVADLVVWSGDPFELSTRAEQVIIGGNSQNIRSRQMLLLERYRTAPVTR